jgi:Protein of unknown function (DUF2844)
MQCKSCLVLVAAAFLVLPTLARAALGDTEASVTQDSVKLHAQRALQSAPTYSIHVLQQADGSVVRQFVSAGQRVFAVSWAGHGKPDLATLLGSSYGRYADGVRRAAEQRPGLAHQFHQVALDLVVHSSAHLNIFKGYAYVPSLVPAGFSLNSSVAQ